MAGVLGFMVGRNRDGADRKLREEVGSRQFTAIAPLCLAAGLALTGCQGLTGPAGGLETGLGGAGQGRPIAGMLVTARSCMSRYDLYLPPGRSRLDPERETLALLAPGFGRHRGQLAGLAARLAAAGLPAVTMDFCASRSWAPRPVRNALELLQIADALGARRIVPIGMSAGGLAAVIAGALDSRTRGVITLDLVDRQGLGRWFAARLDRPLIGLVGAPSVCNARNNGLSVLAASRHARIMRIPDADHCDFEAPTDWRCRLFCARGTPDGCSPRREILDAVVTAARRLDRPDVRSVGRTRRAMMRPLAGLRHRP